MGTGFDVGKKPVVRIFVLSKSTEPPNLARLGRSSRSPPGERHESCSSALQLNQGCLGFPKTHVLGSGKCHSPPKAEGSRVSPS